MIDYRKHRWLPLVLILAWFGWLIAMSRIGLSGLAHIGENLFLRTVWIVFLGVVTFVLPFFLLRRLAMRQNRTR